MIVLIELFVNNLDVIAKIIGIFILLGLITFGGGVVGIVLLVIANSPFKKKEPELKQVIEQLELKLTPVGKLEFSQHNGSNYVHLTVLQHDSHEYELKAKLINADNREARFSNDFNSLYPLVKFIQQNYIVNFKDILAQHR